jgi:small conductance mechanosensitive channel
VISALTDSPCQPGESVCSFVYDHTHNGVLSSAVEWIIAKPLDILFVLAIAVIARWVVGRIIKQIVARAAGENFLAELTQNFVDAKAKNEAEAEAKASHDRRALRAKTLESVLRSVSSLAIFTVAFTIILARLDYNIGPLIAGAGIVGVALGFGAQSLVSDFISGIFMLFEDQYGVGDVVDLGAASGVVEEVTLRVTRLRDVNGTVWYVRNGQIPHVGNMSQKWARAVLDIGVAYGSDLAHVRAVLLDVAKSLAQEADYSTLVLEEPEVWGVQGLDSDQITMRLVVKTAPLQQWAVGRELRERIKARFDAEGIEIPFPQRVVWHRDGSAAQDGADASQAGRDPSNIRVAREGEVSAPGDQGDGSD